MKALTIRQPWPWAILRGWKPEENRSRTTNYRGPLAIHAAKKWDDDAVNAIRFVRDTARAQGAVLPHTLADDAPYATATGLVLGTVDLFDVCTAGLRGKSCECSAWARPGQAHWKFANPRLLSDPFPAKGALYLWDCDMPAPSSVLTALANGGGR